MSIDLDLEALGRAARACRDTADTFVEEADSALESARTLGLGWQGEGYAAFAEKVEASAVPMAHAAADACRSLAEGMEEAHELGESLLLRAENFGYDLGGTGGGNGSSRLFFDEDVIGPIEADIINTETSLAAAQTAFMKAEAALSRLTTCSVSLDSAGFSTGLTNISRGLDTYKESLSVYRSGMEELETLSARVADQITLTFMIKPVSNIISHDGVHDPAALSWWFARPYESLDDEERIFVDALKKAIEDACITRSQENPESVIVSLDGQSVYYQGRKWHIFNPSDTENPGFHPMWNKACDDLVIPFLDINWAQMMAHFGVSEPISSGDKGVNITSASQESRMSFLSSLLGNATDSVKTRKLAFQFEERATGESRVTILGKEKYPSGTLLLSDYAWAPGAHDAARKLWEDETGEEVSTFAVSFYDIACTFDPARSESDAYTSVFYFDSEGALQEQVIRYPKDKVEVVAGWGVFGAIDITDEFYEGAHSSADHLFAEKIREHMKQFDGDGGDE